MEGRRAGEEREQAKVDIKRVRVLVQGRLGITELCDPASDLQWPIRDLLGCLFIAACTHSTYKCNLSSCGHGDSLPLTHCTEQLCSCLSHKHTHMGSLPGLSLRALQLLMWCLQIGCCYGCTFNKQMHSEVSREDLEKHNQMMALLKHLGVSQWRWECN